MNNKANLSEPVLKVAFASGDRKHVDQHFGSAKMFLIYEITPHSSQLLENLQFADEIQDGNESKLMAKLKALTGCQLVYCQAIGPSAVAQLIKCGIQPMRLDEKESISNLVQSLQIKLKEPDPLISRLIKQPNAERFEKLANENWEE
jgi:nitrogen fixation protein NifX